MKLYYTLSNLLYTKENHLKEFKFDSNTLNLISLNKLTLKRFYSTTITYRNLEIQDMVNPIQAIHQIVFYLNHILFTPFLTCILI
jgi:hypothetical protein